MRIEIPKREEQGADRIKGGHELQLINMLSPLPVGPRTSSRSAVAGGPPAVKRRVREDHQVGLHWRERLRVKARELVSPPDQLTASLIGESTVRRKVPFPSATLSNINHL